jgi:hypothetical protein
MHDVGCEQRRENWFGGSRRLISARSGSIATEAGLFASSAIGWFLQTAVFIVHCALCIVHFAL